MSSLPGLNISQNISECLLLFDLGLSWVLIMVLEMFSNNRMFICHTNIFPIFLKIESLLPGEYLTLE